MQHLEGLENARSSCLSIRLCNFGKARSDSYLSSFLQDSEVLVSFVYSTVTFGNLCSFTSSLGSFVRLI